MVALLVNKPWRLSIRQIARLTDWQVRNIYFRPGLARAAKRGYYWPVPNRDAVERRRKQRARYYMPRCSFRTMAYEVWRWQGVTDEAELARRFAERYPGYSGR